MTFSVAVAHGKVPTGSSASSGPKLDLRLEGSVGILNDTTRTALCAYKVSVVLEASFVTFVLGRIVVFVGAVKERRMLGVAALPGLACAIADAMVFCRCLQQLHFRVLMERMTWL